MRSQREETLTHCHLFPLRWLQPQPVQRHQQHSLHRAWVFRLGGGLSLRGRVAHWAPQPGWSEHAQWPRHGAARPLCGRHLPQWQTLNTEGCRFPETHTHAPTSLRPLCMQPLRRFQCETFEGDLWTNTFYLHPWLSCSAWSRSDFTRRRVFKRLQHQRTPGWTFRIAILSLCPSSSASPALPKPWQPCCRGYTTIATRALSWGASKMPIQLHFLLCNRAGLLLPFTSGEKRDPRDSSFGFSFFLHTRIVLRRAP